MKTIAGKMNIRDNAELQPRVYMAAFFVIFLTMAVVILYPENFLRGTAFDLPFGISPLSIVVMLNIPVLGWLVFVLRNRIKPEPVDYLLFFGMTYLFVRGVEAAGKVSIVGLVGLYVLSGLMTYYVSTILGRNRRYRNLIISAIIALFLVSVIYAVLEFAFEKNFLYETELAETMPHEEGSTYRPRSTLGQPILLGAVSVALMPLSFLLYRFGSPRQKQLGLATLIIFPVGILLSFSRLSWFVSVSLLPLILAWSRRKLLKLNWLYLWIAAVLVSLVMVVFIYSDSSAEFMGRHASFGTRQWAWSGAVKAFLAHPLFGVGQFHGPGTLAIIQEYDYPGPPPPIDNYFLTVMAEQGLIGALILAAGLVALMRTSVAHILAFGKAVVKPDFLLFLGLVIILVGGTVYDALMLWPTFFLFWLLLGLLRGMRSAADVSPNGGPKRVGTE